MSGSCWVDTTMAGQERTWPSSPYSTVTWLLPSGRSHLSWPDLRTSARRRDSVGHGDGGGHQLGGLVAGVAEHHALVAGADEVGRVGAALLVLKGLVDAHGDVGGLLVDGSHDGAGAVVEAVGGIGVADALHGAADDSGDVGVVAGGDLAHHGDNAGGGEGLTGHMGGGVGGQDVVQDGVGDLVAHFVGMTLGHGLRGKQTVCHR